jgi:hypothetical protein
MLVLYIGLILMPTRKLLNQGFLVVESKSSLRKLYGRHHDLINRYGISLSHMTPDMFHLWKSQYGNNEKIEIIFIVVRLRS